MICNQSKLTARTITYSVIYCGSFYLLITTKNLHKKFNSISLSYTRLILLQDINFLSQIDEFDYKNFIYIHFLETMIKKVKDFITQSEGLKF